MQDQPTILPRHLEIEVIHEIDSKGSATVGRRRDGSAFVRSASAGLAAYQGAIEAAFLRQRDRLQQMGRSRFEPPYLVEVHFYFSRPARSKYEHPVRLDIDKCTRAVLDALTNAGVIEDDRHVISLVALKDYIEQRDRGRPIRRPRRLARPPLLPAGPRAHRPQPRLPVGRAQALPARPPHPARAGRRGA